MTNFFEIALGKRTRSRVVGSGNTITDGSSTKRNSKSFGATTTTFTSSLSPSLAYYNHTSTCTSLASIDEDQYRDDAESIARGTVESIAEEYYQYNRMQQRALRLLKEQQQRQRHTNTTQLLMHAAYDARRPNRMSSSSSSSSSSHNHNHNNTHTHASTNMSALSASSSFFGTVTSRSTAKKKEKCNTTCNTDLIVLWDCASVPFSTNYATSLLTKSLAGKYGNVVCKRLYNFERVVSDDNDGGGGSSGVDCAADLHSNLCGFDVVLTPTAADGNSNIDNANANANAMMLVDMSSFVWDSTFDRGVRSCVVMVTSNVEFAYGLSRIRDRGSMVIVVFLNEDEICPELQAVAEVCLLLEREYRVAMMPVLDDDDVDLDHAVQQHGVPAASNTDDSGGKKKQRQVNNVNVRTGSVYSASTTKMSMNMTPPRYPKGAQAQAQAQQASRKATRAAGNATFSSGGDISRFFATDDAPASRCKQHVDINIPQPSISNACIGISDIQLICCCVHILEKARTKKIGRHGMSRAKETAVMKLFAAQANDDSQVRYRANRNLAILDGCIRFGFVDQTVARDHVIVIERPWKKNQYITECLKPGDICLFLTNVGRTLIHA